MSFCAGLKKEIVMLLEIATWQKQTNTPTHKSNEQRATTGSSDSRVTTQRTGPQPCDVRAANSASHLKEGRRDETVRGRKRSKRN